MDVPRRPYDPGEIAANPPPILATLRPGHRGVLISAPSSGKGFLKVGTFLVAPIAY